MYASSSFAKIIHLANQNSYVFNHSDLRIITTDDEIVFYYMSDCLKESYTEIMKFHFNDKLSYTTITDKSWQSQTIDSLIIISGVNKVILSAQGKIALDFNDFGEIAIKTSMDNTINKTDGMIKILAHECTFNFELPESISLLINSKNKASFIDNSKENSKVNPDTEYEVVYLTYTGYTNNDVRKIEIN
jgi:hypothetical protein